MQGKARQGKGPTDGMPDEEVVDNITAEAVKRNPAGDIRENLSVKTRGPRERMPDENRSKLKVSGRHMGY